ncbi:glycoside hydrolase superfamily, partial [Pseudomassariella vexata]
MDRRYSFDSNPDERVPLDEPNDTLHHSPSRNLYLQHSSSPQQQPPPHPSLEYENQASSSYQDSRHTSPVRGGNHPGAHPESTFARLREERRRSRGYEAAGSGTGADASQSAPPPAAPHRGHSGRSGWSQERGYAPAPPSAITPGVDNFGEGAAGGLAGIASSIAERNARESGMDAMRDGPHYVNQDYGESYDPQQSHYAQQPHAYDNGYYDQSPALRSDPYAYGAQHYHDSSPSLAPLGAAAFPSERGTPTRSRHSYASDPFEDPHSLYAQRLDPRVGQVDPNDIMDDGDDGLEYRRPARNSMLSLGNASDRSGKSGNAAAAVAGGAAAGGVIGGLGGRNRNEYGPVQNSTGYQAGGASEYDLADLGAKEQSEWIKKQTGSQKKWKWLIVAVVAILVIGGVVGGILGGVVFNKNKSGSSSGGGQSADEDTNENGDLDINSSEIQALLNNKNLHKVFPGVDYTPLNTQYPDCLSNPASQNNITRDVAVLSQLTNVIRLYGTDCNQTQMTIHALRQLKMDSHIKIWMGVWQDGNDTTNDRQLTQMWDILDGYGDEPFAGLIVANEILFREQMDTSQLGKLLSDVRSNLTERQLSLPVATSDLGDKWTSELADVSDYVMANIHPFFGGINAKDAASWTYSFWENNNGAYFKEDKSKNIISETGWPTQGGTDCGSETVTVCPDASVAGIDELNQFMEDWVCAALTNGTNYFWFEMFDEPWKISFDEPGKEWEDHWGLMDVNRKLKEGVKIPDCGGKTV